MNTSQLIKEKGINEDLLQKMAQKGWLQVVAEIPKSNFNLVKEFYIYTDVRSFNINGWVEIRGRRVNFSVEDIIEYYGIPEDDHPNYVFGWSNEVLRMRELILL